MHVRCGNSTMSCDLVTSVPLNADRSLGLGKGESPLLNLAFQEEAETSSKPISTKISARSFSYDETHTSRTTMTTVLKLRGSLVGNRWIILLEDLSAWSSMKGKNTDYSTRISKVMGVASKGDLRTLPLNTGLPKGSNTYRQRNIYSTRIGLESPICDLGNAKWRGRGVASLLFKRNYVSGGDRGEKPNVSLKLNKLAERSNFAPNQIIDRELYSLVSSVDMLIYAYENIKSKPGNMTQTSETLDGISKEKLENISKLLRKEKFTFCRRIDIPKAFGGSGLLSIASPMDKIVQEAMRLVLEAIYEPLFADCSHGFRPNRSRHTALKKVSQEFQPAEWVIEGDQGKFFDTISHHKLMEIIENKIKDRRFTKLIRKALKAGYLTFGRHKINIVASREGSIVSPILANIFLHQLDLFVLSLKESLEQRILGKKAPISKASRYWFLQKASKQGNLNQMRKQIGASFLERSKEPSIDNGSSHFKRLVYVRYADEWIIGIRGSRQEAVSVLEKVKEFCTSIDLTLSDSKTKLTCLNSDTVTFLGTEISRANQVRFSRLAAVQRFKGNKLGIRLEAPLARIRNKLASGSFISKGISAAKFLWLHLEHDQIILQYNGLMRGLLNYYSFSHNYGRLASYIEFILKQSCAKLLARKFNLGTMAKTYKKFGPKLTGPKGKSLFKPSKKMTQKFLTKP